MKNKITISGKAIKKASKRVAKKETKLKWATFTWKPNRKLSKEVRELQEREEAEKKMDRIYLRDVAMYFEGIKIGKGDLLPLSQAHLKAVWRALKKI